MWNKKRIYSKRNKGQCPTAGGRLKGVSEALYRAATSNDLSVL